VGEHAIGELAGHNIQVGWTIVEGRDQGKDRRPGVGGPVHVANVDFVERRFAHAEHQRALLFKADVGGALDEVSADAVGDTAERPHAARDDDHGVRRVGAAGHVGTDIGVGLRMNLAAGFAGDLPDEVGAAAKLELFGHDAKRAVGGDEVDALNSRVAFDCQQEVFQKKRAAGSGGRDGQVLR
jgi:hypothetical protein